MYPTNIMYWYCVRSTVSLTNWVILGVELVKTVKGVAILWEEPVENAADDNI